MDAILNVRTKEGRIRFGDTVAKSLFSLPPSARILDFTVDVTTAFDDTGTDLLNIGTADDDNHFATDVDVSTVAYLSDAQVVKSNLGQQAAHPTEVFGKYAGGNSNSAHGEATVYCTYATIFD